MVWSENVFLLAILCPVLLDRKVKFSGVAGYASSIA